MRFLIALLLCVPIFAQTIDNRNASTTAPFRVSQTTPGTCTPYEYYINTTDNKTYECTSINTWTDTGGGSGTVTSIATSCGIAGGTITTTGTLSNSVLIDSQTGAGAFAIPSADCGKQINRNQAAAVSDTIAQAGTGAFTTGWYAGYQCVGAGGCTITPATSTINGAASLTLVQGQGVTVISDGTNYQIRGSVAQGGAPISGATAGAIGFATSPTALAANQPTLGYITTSTTAPTGGTAVKHNTAGSTAYVYEFTYMGSTGNSAPSATVTVANGNATLDTSNYNVITAPTCAGAFQTTVNVWLVSAGGGSNVTIPGWLANVACGGVYNHQGAPGIGFAPNSSDTTPGLYQSSSGPITIYQQSPARSQFLSLVPLDTAVSGRFTMGLDTSNINYGITGACPGQDTALEFGYNPYHQVTTDFASWLTMESCYSQDTGRAQAETYFNMEQPGGSSIVRVLSWQMDLNGSASLGVQANEMYFDTQDSSKIAMIWNSSGADQGELIWPTCITATSGANCGSGHTEWLENIWNGSASAGVKWMSDAYPASGANPVSTWYLGYYDGASRANYLQAASTGLVTVPGTFASTGAATFGSTLGTTGLATLNSLSVTNGSTLHATTFAGVTGSTQCLHVDSSGVVSGTGGDCGVAGGGSAFNAITSGTNTTATMVVGTGATISAEKDGIAATSTDGYLLTNTTAAANNVQQWSPRLHFIGQGWKTNSTAASQQVEWTIETEPFQGSANPAEALLITPIINATAGSLITLCSQTATGIGESLDLAGNTYSNECSGGGAGFGPVNAGHEFGVFSNGTQLSNVNANGFLNSSGTFMSWASGLAGNASTGDSGVCRGAVGLLAFNDGSATCPSVASSTHGGAVQVTDIDTTGFPFASLPTCTASTFDSTHRPLGALLYCTDCKNFTDDTTGTYDAAATSGGHGTNVLCEGSGATAWRNH